MALALWECSCSGENRRPHLPQWSRIFFGQLSAALQKVRNGSNPGVRHEAHHAGLADLEVDAIRLRKNGVAFCNIEFCGASATLDNKKPGLLFRFQTPLGAWRQIN